MRPLNFAAAYFLDLIAGDPEWFPHPVRGIGWAISVGDKFLRKFARTPRSELIAGAILTGSVVATSAAVVRNSPPTFEILLAWTTLATGSLLHETKAVIDALDRGNLDLARRRLSRIVGRDTHSLNTSEISRAVIETAAESLCDGVIAPLCYLTLGGVRATFAYKAVNTLDSMIGHREPPYTFFGRVAARLDDVANFIPARATALCIAAASPNRERAIKVWRRDGSHHPSPNSGQCEAAMAGALGVALGGTNYYDGVPSHRSILGREGRTPTPRDARAAIRIVATSSGIAFACGFAILWATRKR